LKEWGFDADDFAEKPIAVWPPNRLATLVFLAMSTQWRTGAAGATGLDYGALDEVWKRLNVPRKKRDATFSDLRVIEAGALNEMHKPKD
jgi:hypothetical protein